MLIRSRTVGSWTAGVALAALGCASGASEQRFDSATQRLDRAIEHASGTQDRIAAQEPSPARADELERCRHVMQALLLARAGYALAYMADDSAGLDELEAKVDAILDSHPDLARE